MKITKMLLFIIGNSGIKIHYHGITTHFIVYTVPESSKINRQIRATIVWKLENKYYVTENSWIGR